MSGVRASMHLESFAREQAGCVVVRPDVAGPALACGFGLVGMAAGGVLTLVCFGSEEPTVALVCLAVAVVCGWVAHGRLPEWRAARALARRGLCSYAVSDHALLLVGASGRAALVPLDRVTGLKLCDRQPWLCVEGDGAETVYGVLLELFDARAGLDAKRFFEQVACRLEERYPAARVERDEPLPLVVEPRSERSPVRVGRAAVALAHRADRRAA